MSLRRRRYQSLGLTKRNHNRPRSGPLEGVEKFVSESHVNDLILYNRVTRARPGIRQLEFANEDVDWQLEYFCEKIGKWMHKLLGWLLGIFLRFMKFLGFKRKLESGDDASSCSSTGDGDSGKYRQFQSHESDHSGGGDGRSNRKNSYRKLSSKDPEIVWMYENCIPYLNRRILKRKWLFNPNVKKWAENKVELYQKNVKRGYRTLRSGTGKDTTIYVVCSSTEVEANQSTTTVDENSPFSSPPLVYVFRADSRVLQSHSTLFRKWFKISQNDKKIATSFITPREMEAILVYMYTLTWPTGMMIKGEGSKAILDPRFVQVLQMHGMTFSLPKEFPPPDGLLTESKLLDTIREERPFEIDENQNVAPLNEIRNRRLSSSNIGRPPDGQGDQSQCFLDTAILKPVGKKESSSSTCMKDFSLVGTPLGSSARLGRSLKMSKFQKVKDSLRISFPKHRHRVHPATNITPNLRKLSKKATALYYY